MVGDGAADKSKRPLRYIAGICVTVIIAVLLLFYFSLSARFLAFLLLSIALVVSSIIDFEKQEIPDVITLSFIPAGLVLMTIFRIGGDGGTYMSSFVNSLLGALSGAGVMLLMGGLGWMLFRKEALGGGDVKLMAMIGAFLGWKLTVLTFFVAPFLAVIPGLYLKIRYGDETMPYGPFLAAGALVSLFAGAHLNII